jgi:dimeric dUTPase (all-alpha-NTP-PPase superfamily)
MTNVIENEGITNPGRSVSSDVEIVAEEYHHHFHFSLAVKVGRSLCEMEIVSCSKPRIIAKNVNYYFVGIMIHTVTHE